MTIEDDIKLLKAPESRGQVLDIAEQLLDKYPETDQKEVYALIERTFNLNIIALPASCESNKPNESNEVDIALESLERENNIPIRIAKISGLLHDGIFYSIIPVSYNGNYFFACLTENKDKLMIRSREEEFLKERFERLKATQNKEERKAISSEILPDDEKYYYFYTPEDIEKLCPYKFFVVYKNIQDIKGQSWFEIILRKI